MPKICNYFLTQCWSISIRLSHVAIQVTKTIEEERRKWEAEKMEAVRVHCGRLEEQSRHRLESMRSEMQQEKSKALALQHNVAELKAVR